MEVLGLENIDKVQSAQLSPTPKNGTPQILYVFSTVAFLVLFIVIYVIHRKSEENENLARSNEQLLAENLRLGRILNAKDKK
jgi:hypothetical protein